MYGYTGVHSKAEEVDLESGETLYPGLSAGENQLRWGFIRKVIVAIICLPAKTSSELHLPWTLYSVTQSNTDGKIVLEALICINQLLFIQFFKFSHVNIFTIFGPALLLL
uniref:Uncharacterized protein n=1 Tax=Cannabis sativa TaxID=3483 RepID=A0A803R4D8_CANSA